MDRGPWAMCCFVELLQKVGTNNKVSKDELEWMEWMEQTLLAQLTASQPTASQHCAQNMSD